MWWGSTRAILCHCSRVIEASGRVPSPPPILQTPPYPASLTSISLELRRVQGSPTPLHPKSTPPRLMIGRPNATCPQRASRSGRQASRGLPPRLAADCARARRARAAHHLQRPTSIDRRPQSRWLCVLVRMRLPLRFRLGCLETAIVMTIRRVPSDSLLLRIKVTITPD